MKMWIPTRYTRVLCYLLLFMLLGEMLVHVSGAGEDIKEKSYSSFLTLSSSSFPEQLDMDDYCQQLLHQFAHTYASLMDCLVSNARPVKVCQDCYITYNSFHNISVLITEMGPGNVTCQDALLRSDRLMLLYNLNSSLQDIWDSAYCVNCLTPGQKNVSDTTLYFLELLNETLTCFEKYQQGNHSELCASCNTSYKSLNVMYSGMPKNNTLCIDLEDAMNVTRRLWSKKFNCSLKREENVPVIAVSSFMLFLPLIFYLSNYLHSEQKKRKLIHPQRAKSSHSLMSIQDKYS